MLYPVGSGVQAPSCDSAHNAVTVHAIYLLVFCPANRRNLTGRSMAQSSARSKFKTRPVHLGFVADIVAVGQFFFRRISVVTCQYHSANTPHAFIHLSPTLHNPYQLTASLNNTLRTATYRTSQRDSSRGTVFQTRHKVTQDSELYSQF